MATEDQYREIFQAEALENFEELNKLFTRLEKNYSDKKAINAIFRITHTLKGNALGMGFKDIGDMAHVMEDIFGEVRENKLELDPDIFDALFKALDKLGELIDSLKTNKKVRYKGLKTKLKVILRKAQEESVDENAEGGVALTADEPEVVSSDNTEVNSQSENEEPKKPAKKRRKKKVEKKTEEVVDNKEIQQEESLTELVEETEEIQIEEEKQETPELEEEVLVSPPVEVKTSDDSEEEEEDDEEEEEEEESETKIAFSDLVQVPVRKLDELLNLVGELIIERDRILATATGARNEYSRLMRITSDIQYSVMDVRLVQVGFLFNKFHRVLRDAARVEGKKVNLNLEGTETEIDRNVLQIISDSMIHLVRNSVGHGIEKPDDRIKAGKPEEGTVTLRARNESDTVVIEIQDNGKGIDPKIIAEKALKKGFVTKEHLKLMSDNEIRMLIFEPGFSSMDEVTAISGRGVGMDVVKRSIDSIGGSIELDSEVGKGSTISLFLPSSMAVKGALLFILNEQEFAIPLSHTEAVVQFKKNDIHKVKSGLMATYLQQTISIIFLDDAFEAADSVLLHKEQMFQKSLAKRTDDDELNVVIVNHNGTLIGVVVDRLLQQKDIVEKPLRKPVDQIGLFSGATILGNGAVCPVLNIPGLVNHVFRGGRRQ